MRRALALVRPARHLVPPALLVAFVALLLAKGCDRPEPSPPASRPPLVEPQGDLAADERTTIALFERASPAVVHVANLVVVRDWRSSNPMEVPRGTGTGFVWDEKGHIVTNFHVVDGGDDFVVTFADRTQSRARLVGGAPSFDLAVLRIDTDGRPPLAPLPVGTSSGLRVGQKVFAIGNPFGLDQTLTSGIVSGLGREILAPTQRPIYDVIQSDAAINPGNSGGPLLDSSGRVIGVNTQIASPTGASAGIGFSIPAATVLRVVPELIREGRYVRPVLGILAAHEFDPRSLAAQGAVVDQVTRGLGAERAGIRPSDVVVQVADAPVRSRTDLFRAVDRQMPGRTVPVKVVRGGKEVALEVTLAGLADSAR